MRSAGSNASKPANRRKLVAALLLFAAAPLCGAAELSALSAERLRTGGYVWNGAADGPVRIVVSRSQQRAYVYSGDDLIAVSTVSTGKPGHRTPLGEFTILEKRVHHRSNQYGNAPMPFMQRLTWGGVAMHGGHLPGYAASHGCIRLPLAFARRLFAATALGATVEVTDGGPALPRVEMAAAAPAPAAPVVAAPPQASPVVIAAAAAPRVQFAAAERIRPPRASWREQSADDFVTWGSAVPGAPPPAGTQ